jgi:hypothetical protein
MASERLQNGRDLLFERCDNVHQGRVAPVSRGGRSGTLYQFYEFLQLAVVEVGHTPVGHVGLGPVEKIVALPHHRRLPGVRARGQMKRLMKCLRRW